MRNFIRIPLGMILLAVLAFGTGCSKENAPADPQDDAPYEKIDPDPAKTPPKVLISPDAHVDDPSFNAFIREFADICMQGEYDKYRLKVRRKADPVSKESFEKVWHRVEQVRIDTTVELPASEGSPGPRYAVFAKVKVSTEINADAEGEPEKTVALYVLKEGGEWVIDALPADVLNQILAVAAQPTTAPATAPAATTQASANQP